MREFNSRSISIVIGKNYVKAFPNRKGKITVFSHGIKESESLKRILNAFYCYDPNYGCIGHAIHYVNTKILRFYNHEGEDMGLETNMVFKPFDISRGIKQTINFDKIKNKKGRKKGRKK